MENKPIAVGDLVCVVRAGGFCSCYLGTIFIVQEIAPSPDGYLNCSLCRVRAPTGLDARKPDDKGWHSLAQLKRIPPLSELESERREEKEPA